MKSFIKKVFIEEKLIFQFKKCSSKIFQSHLGVVVAVAVVAVAVVAGCSHYHLRCC